MDSSFRPGLTINSSSGKHYLEIGKLHKCSENGWLGYGLHYGKSEYYRIWADRWYPVGTIGSASEIMDIDLYLLDKDDTIYINGFTKKWLDENEPKSYQIELF